MQNFWVDRNHPGMGIFHFSGYSSISDAEKLREYDVLLPFDERVVLPAGQYFVTDLIGCTVFQVATETSKLASPACEMEVAPQALWEPYATSSSQEKPWRVRRFCRWKLPVVNCLCL